MPNYSFYCPKCKHKFEGVFSMNESGGENIICPKCGKKGVERNWEGSFYIKKKSSCPSCLSGRCNLN